MGEEIEGAMQHAPQPGRQSMRPALRVAGAGSSGLDHYIVTIPIFVPNNTQADYKLDVDVDTFDDEELFCESRSTSWALVMNFSWTTRKIS